MAEYMPLNQSHCDACTNVAQDTMQVAEFLEKCRRAGWPVDEAIEINKQQHELAVNTKRELWPGAQ